jgi:hypothetical protein
MRVTLHAWRLPRRNAARALLRMATDPSRLRRLPGVRFAKLLGTSTGTTFQPSDADLTRYAAIVCHDDDRDPRDLGAVGRAWDKISDSAVRVELRTLRSSGRWSGAEPFGPPTEQEDDGPVLALTRARLRPAKALTFYRSVPAVVRELDAAPGLLARLGIGEAPIGLQGTISVWQQAAHLAAFAYRQPEHRAVIARTPAVRWYAEDLFARFAVMAIHGDRAVLGWREGER